MSPLDLPGLETWSRAVGGATMGDVGPVIVVPPDGDPDLGLQRALAVTSPQAPARLIMRGATQVQSESPLILCELDAYIPGDKGPLQLELVPGLKRWVGLVFEGAIDGVDVSSAFWASVITRLGLQDVFDAWVFAKCIASRHQLVEVTDRGWVGADMLASLGVAPAVARSLPSAASFIAQGVVAASAAIGLRLRELAQERKTRQFLEAQKATGPLPTIWLGVIGHWEFSSRHVLGSLGAAAKSSGVRVGVLLESSLKPGALTDAHRQRSRDERLLPVLSSEALEGAWSHVDQLVSASSVREFAESSFATFRAMTRAIRRYATVGAVIDFGVFSMPAPRNRSALAALTLDILRGREAAAATRRFVAKHDLAGARIALSHASLVTDATPDLILQQAGVVTFDVVHGALAEPLDMMTTAKTFSSQKLLWTNAEAQMLKAYTSSECIGAVPSRRWQRMSHRPTAHTPLRVLLMSNYGTLVGGAHRTKFPRLGYQRQVLSAFAFVVQPSMELIWRPHPSDDRTSISKDVSRFGLTLSTSSLDDDLVWADIIVTSLSSTVVEALAWEKPLLIHDIPVHEADVLMSLFSPTRRFRNAAELARALELAAADAQSGQRLGPEAKLRQLFFGESGHPADIAEVVFGDKRVSLRP